MKRAMSKALLPALPLLLLSGASMAGTAEPIAREVKVRGDCYRAETLPGTRTLLWVPCDPSSGLPPIRGWPERPPA